jgi:hypothetical protein
MSVAAKQDANFYLITLQTLSCAPLNEDDIPELQHLKNPKLIDPIKNLIVQAWRTDPNYPIDVEFLARVLGAEWEGELERFGKVTERDAQHHKGCPCAGNTGGSATIGRDRQACRLCIGLEDMKKDYKVPQTRDFVWRHDAFREERIRKGEFDVFGKKMW